MRSALSGPWDRLMAAALIASIIACVVFATTAAEITPPPKLVVTTAQDVDVIRPDCSQRKVDHANADVARLRRQLDGDSALEHFGEWAAEEIARGRALLTACGVAVVPCFDLVQEVRWLEQELPLSRNRDNELETSRRVLLRCQDSGR